MTRAFAALAAVVFVAACDDGTPERPAPTEYVGNIRVTHDVARGVTCYAIYGNGLSCLSDSQLADGGSR